MKDKPVCGTLCYLAECRGTAQKDRPEQRMTPPDDMRKIIRMRPSL